MAGVLVSACVGSKPCGGFSCKGYYKLIAIQINKGIPAGASPAISFIYKAFNALYYSVEGYQLKAVISAYINALLSLIHI